MGKMGGSPSTTTQISEVKLPAWVEEAAKSNYEFAKNVANRPLTQYEGARVADTSNMTNQAYSLLSKNVGIADPMYKDAYSMLQRAGTELDPEFEKARKIYEGTTGPWDVNQYLNPFIGEVENRAIDNANRSLQGQLSAIGDKAKAAGAFGGSRAAVESGVTRAEGTRGIGDLSAQLRKQGFDTATANLLADRASKQAGAAGILSGATAQQKGWLETASGLQGLGTARQDSLMKDVTGLMTGGAQEQAQRQKQIDADMEKFYEARDYPMQQLNTLLASLGMSPHGQTETTTKTSKSESQGADFATLGLGLLKILGGLSDRRDKTDIEKVGRSETTGLPVYAYRYKGDPKTYPKVVGPMAQDVEKKYPGSTTEIGGHKVVKNIGLLAA
jgi:hypothetical protein